MKSKIIAALVLVFVVTIATGEPVKVYGGKESEHACALAQGKGSGYCLAGWTKSFGRNAPKYSNVLVLYADSTGAPRWARVSTGMYDDEATSMVKTRDSRFAVTGWTTSYSRGTRSDVFALRVDQSGQINWAKAFVSGMHERAHSIIQTADQGYAIAGSVEDRDSSATRNVFMMKLNREGNLQWAKSYDVSRQYEDEAFGIAEVPDNPTGIRYVLTGRARIEPVRNYDAFALYLDSNGIPLRLFIVPGDDDDEAHSVIWDGSAFVVAGWTNSYGPGAQRNGNCNIFVWKITLNGTFVLGSVYGWPQYDEKILDDKALIKSKAGGYVISGMTRSVGPNIPQPNFLILKVDSTGQTEWCTVHPSQGLGPLASHSENACAVIERDGGGYAVTGWSKNRSFGLGEDDLHFLTLNATGGRRTCTMHVRPETGSIEQDTFPRPEHFWIELRSAEMVLARQRVPSANVCPIRTFGSGD
jgi:hypothetical protein